MLPWSLCSATPPAHFSGAGRRRQLRPATSLILASDRGELREARGLVRLAASGQVMAGGDGNEHVCRRVMMMPSCSEKMAAGTIGFDRFESAYHFQRAQFSFRSSSNLGCSPLLVSVSHTRGGTQISIFMNLISTTQDTCSTLLVLK